MRTYHNATLRRIAAVDAQLDALRKLLRSAEWRGAGLSVTVCAGPQSAENARPVTFELGISAGDLPEQILRAGEEGLQHVRAFWAKVAVDEYNELVEFTARLNDERHREKARARGEV